MTVTKSQLAEAYAAALNKALGKQWDYEFSRRDASKFLDVLWPVVSGLSLKDNKKSTPGSVPLGNLSSLKMRYKPATKARKGTNPFTGDPATFTTKPAPIQPPSQTGSTTCREKGCT